MKKIIITTIIIFCILIGCGNSRIEETANNQTVSISENEISEETQTFLEVPSEEESEEKYREEVSKRLKSSGTEFLNPEEQEYLESKGYDCYSDTAMKYTRFSGSEIYTYPIVYQSDFGIELWYTNSYGNFNIVPLAGEVQNYPNNNGTHYSDIFATYIERSARSITIYESSTGRVSVWELGELKREWYVPQNSVFIGISEWEGYIFRSNTDVYSIRNMEGCFDVRVIAHNVEQVLQADYCATRDAWSQPLFQMTDGTLKWYGSWNEEEGGSADDESNLRDICHEGGFKF